MSEYAYMIEAWPEETDSHGQPVMHRYAAMAASRAKALALAKAALPSDWKVEAPDWPPYGEAIIADHGLKSGEVRRIE